ncbi:hypothetical protein [Yeosuana sp. AK3]
MRKPNRTIKSNFDKYEELLNGSKNSSTKSIYLDEIKLRHQNTRIKTVDVIHNSIPERLELIVESKIVNKKDFKFKLRAPEYTGEPFFRFDSDGVSHYNRTPDVELPKQKVDTPHFHKFDANGREIAYKTQALLDEGNKEALLNDISLCMAHYCDESNTSYKNSYIEVVQTPITELDLDIIKDNPLEGVEYE